MKLRSMKKVVAVAMTAAMVLGSISVTPPAEVMAENAAPAITAQAAKEKNGIKVTWNKLDDETVTGYRVYRMVSSDDAEAIATLDTNGVSTKSWKFDFGPNEEITEEGAEAPISCLAEGYTSISQENAYYTQAQGYGFTQGIPTAAGGTLAFINRTDGKKMSADVLNGDFATITAPEGGSLTAGGASLEAGQSYMEFVVDVPNGEYKATATHSGYVTGRNISVFWFQGQQAERHPVNNNIAVSERTVNVTDGKLKISASASASGNVVFPPALSAVTIAEVTEVPTGIDVDGSLYCNDITADLTKNYTYKVVAMKGETEAADLNSGDIKPVVAPTVSAGETTTTSAKLSINNNEVETDSYNIYRKKSSDASFTKVAEFTNINEDGKFTADKIIKDKQIYVNDDFSDYELGSAENNKNLFDAEKGDWTVLNGSKGWYTGMVMDKSNDNCMNGVSFLSTSSLENYDGAFILLALGADPGATFHKKLTDSTKLNGPTRLKMNFALPNFFANKQNRNVGSCCLYLADKEITENDVTSGYVAKLEYSREDNSIYLNDSEVYNFGTGADATRSKWNTITLDIDPETKKISYEFEREAGAVVINGSVTIPDASLEPAAQEGEGGADEASYATLSFTGAGDPNSSNQRWGTIAIDNLKFASTETVDGSSRVYTYTDNNLDPNTEYNYYVGAVAGNKEIVKSSIASAKTQPIVADRVSLSQTSIEIKKGDTIDVPVATVSPDNASPEYKTVTWSSENESIATVENGKIKGTGAGTTNIIAKTKNGMTANCAVTVTAVTLNRTNLSLRIGDTQTLTATVKPDSVTNKGVTWKSDKESIATVDANGKVTAIAAGTAMITVTANNNGETATCRVTVTKAAVTGITLNATSGSLKKGESVTLVATIAPANATVKDITWSSSNNNVATVTKNGVVKAMGKGTAVITATSVDNARATATYNLTVTEPVRTIPATKVIIKKPASKSLNKGKTMTLKAVTTPSNSTDKLSWKSSNKKIATVTSSGKVKGIGKGTATITVTTTSGKKATIKITVKIPAKKVKLSKSKVTLKKGKSVKLKAKLTPSNSTDKVTWKTSNKKVAAIKNGKVTAKKKGKATITAKTTSGKTAKCKITVK